MKMTTQLTLGQPDQARGVQPDVLADGLLTVADAAKFLAVGRSTVYAAMETGQLPYCKLGRARRIPKRALLAFVQANLTGGWAVEPHLLSSALPQDVALQEVAKPCCHRVAIPTNQNGHPR
jgi:excisionase family DNA binding protein